MRNIILCGLMAMSLTQTVDAAFPAGSRCKLTDQISTLAATQIYGSKALQKNSALFKQTYEQVQKDKPSETDRFCQMDNSGNKVS